MKRFKKAYIEITNSCNLNCSFCPKTTREKKFLEVDEYKKIINEIKPYVNFLYLHLMGEPLLHPHLDEILKVSYDNSMKINITTNGTLIKNKLDDIINNKCVRKVSFSLHSFEANDNTNFDHYIDDIINASKILSSNDITVVLKLWNLDSTNNDVLDKEGLNNLNDNIISKLISSLSKKYNEENILKVYDELLKRNTCEINKHIYLQTGEKFEWPVNTKDKTFDKIFCYGLLDQFGVLSNGDVVPCCLDNNGEIKLGNIFNESFKDILEKEETKIFIKNMKDNIPPCALCKKCSYARKKV